MCVPDVETVGEPVVVPEYLLVAILKITTPLPPAPPFLGVETAPPPPPPPVFAVPLPPFPVGFVVLPPPPSPPGVLVAG